MSVVAVAVAAAADTFDVHRCICNPMDFPFDSRAEIKSVENNGSIVVSQHLNSLRHTQYVHTIKKVKFTYAPRSYDNSNRYPFRNIFLMIFPHSQEQTRKHKKCIK